MIMILLINKTINVITQIKQIEKNHQIQNINQLRTKK